MLADGGPVCALCGKKISSDLEESDPLCSLNCHKKCVFHVQCAHEWFKRWKCCPICREEPLPYSHRKPLRSQLNNIKEGDKSVRDLDKSRWSNHPQNKTMDKFDLNL